MIKAYFRNSMAASGARHCPDFTTDFAGTTAMAEPVAVNALRAIYIFKWFDFFVAV
jgi:hypothetical protein